MAALLAHAELPWADYSVAPHHRYLKSMTENLNSLFDKVKMGDKAAFDALFLRSYPVLITFARKQLGDAAEAENIVQDIMLYLWENRKKLQINDINSYLFTSVKNKCATRVSHLRTMERVHASIRTKGESSAQPVQDIDIINELAHRLDDALKQMPLEYRETFEMNRFRNKNYKEIADIMNVSPKTVAWRMSKVLGELRRQLCDFL